MSISAAVTSLRPTIERLMEFAALGPDWDSYGGLPASPRATSTATELLILIADRLLDLDPARLVPYAVAPIADGGVQVEWRGRSRDVEVEIGPRGELGCLLIERRGEDLRFEEHNDASQADVIDLVVTVLLGEHAG